MNRCLYVSTESNACSGQREQFPRRLSFAMAAEIPIQTYISPKAKIRLFSNGIKSRATPFCPVGRPEAVYRSALVHALSPFLFFFFFKQKNSFPLPLLDELSVLAKVLADSTKRSFPAILSHSHPNPFNPPTSLSSAMAHSNISRRIYQNTRTPSTSGAAYHPRAQGQSNQSRPVFRNNRTPSTSGTASHTRARDQGSG
ncbi:hypothetical protein BDW75DRAFT_56310 [Aspergillus navahoensis]